MDFGLLGPIEVRRDDAPVLIGKRQHRAVLAMLLLRPGEVVPTDELVEGLWPRTLPDQPLPTLQTHIARLRRALEPDRPAGTPNARLLTRPPGYLLTVSPQELDVSRFHGLAVAGRDAVARGDPARAVERLDAALAQWRGPALGEFRDEAFASAAVTRLEEERIGALEDRVGASLSLGRAAALVPELEELVLRHPLRERLWAHLALALYRSERQADAIRRCQDARVALGEIGLDAGPTLHQLEDAILRHDPDLLTVPHRPEPASGSKIPSLIRPTAARVEAARLVCPPLPAWLADDRPVVDRDEALAVADRVWHEVKAGHRRLLLLRGEPGIGKTRLAGEVAAGLIEEGAVVLGGRCSEEPLLPHEPFVEAVRLGTEVNPGVLVSMGSDAGHLAPVLPGVLLLSAVDDTDLSPDTARYLMFTAVDRLLSALATDRPAVLVIDDLQWADRSTLRLLSHLVATPGRPLLVIGTYRDTELCCRHPLPDAVAELHRQDLATDLGLRRLSVEAVTHLVRSEGGLSEIVGGQVHSRTDGNPLFVREVIQNLLPDWDRSRVLEIPDNVRVLLLRRLRRLPQESRRTIEAASVIGRRIDADLLARVRNRSLVEVAEDLAEATRAGLLTDDPATGPAFTHDLARDVTEHDLSAIARAVLHRTVGEAVLDRDGDGDGQLGTLARHFTAAAVDGDPRRAIEFSHRAGRRAFELLAHDEAVSRFQSGLRALDRSGTDDPAGRLTLLVDLVDAHYRAGDELEAGTTADEAWELAREVGTAEQRVRAAAGVAYGAWGDQIRAIRAVEAMIEAGRLIGDEPDADLVRLLQVLASTYGLINQHRQGAQVMRHALDVADALGEPLVLAWTWFLAATVLVNEASVDERIRWTEQALVTADEQGDRELQVLSMVQIRVLHLENGDVLGTERVWARYQREVEALNIPRYNAGHAQRRGLFAMLWGNYEQAEMAANEMVFHQANDTFFEVLAAQMLVIRLDQGRLIELEPTAREAADRTLRPAWVAAHAMVLSEIDCDTEAAERLAMVTSSARSLERNLTWLSTMVTTASAVSWSGTAEQASTLIELLRPERHRLCIIGTGAACLGSVEHYLGRLEARRGELDDAEIHLRRAINVHEHVQAHPRASYDRLALAQVLFDRDRPGDRDEAAELVEAGLAAAERFSLGHRAVRWARARELTTER